MKFKSKYRYNSNPNGDIELEYNEYHNEEGTGVLNSQEQTPIKFTDKETPIELRSNQRVEFTRKQMPVFSGVLNYFPDAIRELAKVSYVGNQQHNPDKPLHWDRSKSGDELDALSRHLLEAGTIDTDGIRHSAKVAWRALANLQKELENETK
jgi:hypothetical protein